MVSVIIILLIIGCVLILASFIFGSSMSKGAESNIMTADEIERLVERRFSEVKYRLDNEAEKSADLIKDQTERELEKLSNEKIMAVNEYSDQVMDQINKNHNEVMFLYSMLSDKQKELDHAVEHLNHVKQEAANEEQLAKHKQKEQAKEKDIQTQEDTQTQEDDKEVPVYRRRSETQEAETNSQNVPQRRRLGLEPSGRTPQSKRAAAMELENYDNKERILLMHAEGLSSKEIAQKLHMGVGEVRLVLELSKER